MTLMGYSMPDDKEIYSLDEIVKNFDPKRIGVSGAYFDVGKLDWLNQQYLIQNVPESQLWQRIKEWSFNEAFMAKLMPLCHTRIKTFGDFMDLCGFFFINKIVYTDEMLCPSPLTREKVPLLLQAIIWSMDEGENWGRSGIEKAAHDIAEIFGVNFKKVVIPILFATFTGKRQGPPLFDSVQILGKDRARARLLGAIEFLGGISNKKMDGLTKAWTKKDGKELLL
jgi:glutamyl-tRNA synthetase